jgi:hypothetical protein
MHLGDGGLLDTLQSIHHVLWWATGRPAIHSPCAVVGYWITLQSIHHVLWWACAKEAIWSPCNEVQCLFMCWEVFPANKKLHFYLRLRTSHFQWLKVISKTALRIASEKVPVGNFLVAWQRWVH